MRVWPPSPNIDYRAAACFVVVVRYCCSFRIRSIIPTYPLCWFCAHAGAHLCLCLRASWKAFPGCASARLGWPKYVCDIVPTIDDIRICICYKWRGCGEALRQTNYILKRTRPARWTPRPKIKPTATIQHRRPCANCPAGRFWAIATHSLCVRVRLRRIARSVGCVLFVLEHRTRTFEFDYTASANAIAPDGLWPQWAARGSSEIRCHCRTLVRNSSLGFVCVCDCNRECNTGSNVSGIYWFLVSQW